MTAFLPREHRIPAHLGELKEARDFCARMAAEFGLDEDACLEVRLALSEAVANAIRHGSSSADDEVLIMVAGEPGAIIFEVLDTGRFRPRVARHGDIPESGRGLEFMRLMMDQVELQPGRDGNRVRMVKRLP